MTDSVTPRRTFVKAAAAAGAAALIATRPSLAKAESVLTNSSPNDDWVKRIRGAHKQVVDVTMPNNGFAPAFALNFIDGYKLQGVPESQLTSVLSFRHFALPLVVNDSIWAKYKFAEMIGAVDSKTKAPAMRNIYRDAIFSHPGLTYEQLLGGTGTKATIIMTACNVALHALSGMTAANAGVSAEEAAAEWKAGLLPGVVLVPSGVYAISRAQEAGCTYCFGG